MAQYIDFVRKYGATSLICASRKGDDKMVDLLLKNGANVDAVDK